MPSDSGRTTSVWMATANMPRFAALAADAKADVAVVGGGISGLTTAYMLAKAGKHVVVLDDNALGGGETGRTTGHLSSALDDRYQFLEKAHGAEGSRLAYESHDSAISEIESIARAESIACDFERVDGYLFLAGDQDESILQKELEAAHRAGFSDVEFVPRAPLSGFDTGRCLRFPRQAQFHVLKYLAGMAAAIERLGGSIHVGNHVEKIEGDGPLKVRTAAGPVVTADAAVVATNSPLNVPMHKKQAAYRTYAVGLRVPAGTVFSGLYWDTLDPYHYARTQRVSAADGSGEHDVLIVGGEDHKTGQEEVQGHFDALEAWGRERFPMSEAVEFRWSGQVLEPADGLAFLGRVPDGPKDVYLITGDSGHGLTHGTIGAMIVADLIAGKENPWAKLYDPSRKLHGALREVVGKNIGIALRYGEWLTPGEVASADEVKPGHGAVVRKGLSKMAIYRDDSGTVHGFSAVCPHLGCFVHWNDVERSWDCPCHGSRFDARGKVVNGPSVANLKPVDWGEKAEK